MKQKSLRKLALLALLAIGFAYAISSPKSTTHETWEREFFISRAVAALCFYSAWRLGGAPDLSKSPTTHR